MNLASCMVDDVMAVPQFLAAFGRLHARLHGLEVTGLPGPAGGHPLDELLERAGAEAVRREVDDELAWLDENRPGETERPRVLCHGDLNPVHVYVAGGDASTAVPVNWTRARRAEAAYDVAGTVTAFWTAPLYVDSTVQRTALKVVRDSLISAYLKAYGEASRDELDDGALRYWQAFHLAALAVDLARRLHERPPGPWDPAGNVTKPADALQDLRHHFRELARP
jgi:aminoglycoside phosphotransferase (APT) family kinase protein